MRPGIVTGVVATLVIAAGVAGLAALSQQRAAKEAVELYHSGNSLFETGQYTQAEQVYTQLLDRRSGAPYAAEVRYKMALLLEDTERYGDASAWWAKVAAEPNGVSPVEISYHRGICAARLGEAGAARSYFEDVRGAGESVYAPDAALQLGHLARADGDRASARQFYERAVVEATTRDVILAAGAALREINLRSVRDRSGDPEGQVVHLVRTGDNLQALAERYRSTVDLIMEVNGISDPSRLRIGQRLVIPQLDLSLVVNKTEFTLTVYEGDRIFGVYPVGLGKDGSTPVGQFEIKEKIKDPTWWSPAGPVPPGHPENELGSRWMGMRPLEPGIGDGYGIHSTIQPETIGREASNGCPRMYEEDAKELFRLIRIGTPVRVVAA